MPRATRIGSVWTFVIEANSNAAATTTGRRERQLQQKTVYCNRNTLANRPAQAQYTDSRLGAFLAGTPETAATAQAAPVAARFRRCPLSKVARRSSPALKTTAMRRTTKSP